MTEPNSVPPRISEESKLGFGDQTPDVVEADLLPCCLETVKQHASFNPMMVCSECKQFIKCFNDENQYRNYLKFCRSRHRKVNITRHAGMLVVVYRSYGNYGEGNAVRR